MSSLRGRLRQTQALRSGPRVWLGLCWEEGVPGTTTGGLLPSGMPRDPSGSLGAAGGLSTHPGLRNEEIPVQWRRDAREPVLGCSNGIQAQWGPRGHPMVPLMLVGPSSAGSTGLPPGWAQAFGTGQSQPSKQPLPWEKPLLALLLLGFSLEIYRVGCHQHGSIPGAIAPSTEEGFFSLSPLPGFILRDSRQRLQLPHPKPGLCVLLKPWQWE